MGSRQHTTYLLWLVVWDCIPMLGVYPHHDMSPSLTGISILIENIAS
jgi:hypothetical protein